MSRSRGLEIKRARQALRACHAQHSGDVLDDVPLARPTPAWRRLDLSRSSHNQIPANGLNRLKPITGESAALLQ